MAGQDARQKGFMRDVCRLQGGQNEHVVVVELDIASLQAFQSREKRGDERVPHISRYRRDIKPLHSENCRLPNIW